MFEHLHDASLPLLIPHLKAVAQSMNQKNESEFVRKAILCGLTACGGKSRSQFLPFLSTPAVCQAILKPFTPSEQVAFTAQLPQDTQFIAAQFLHDTVRLPDLQPPDDVRLLASLLDCDLTIAAVLWWSFSSLFSLFQTEDRNFHFSQSSPADPHLPETILSRWSDNTFPEFGDAAYSQLPPPFLLHRLGFRDRAISLLRDYISSMNLDDIKDLFAESEPVAEPALRSLVFLESKGYGQVIQEFLANYTRDVTFRTFRDYQVLRNLRALSRAIQCRPASTNSIYRLTAAEPPQRFESLRLIQEFLNARCKHLCLPPLLVPLDGADLCTELHAGFTNCRRIETSLEEMVAVVFSGPLEPQWLPAAFTAVCKGLAQSPDNPVFLSAWLKESAISVKYSIFFMQSCTAIPFAWTPLFAKLICTAPEFSGFVPLLHRAFGLLYVGEGLTWLPDAAYDAAVLRRALLDACRAVEVEGTWRLSRFEADAVRRIRRGEEVAGGVERPNPGGVVMLASHIGMPAAVPLVEEAMPGCLLSVFRERWDDLHVQVRILLFTGQVMRYVISPAFASDPRWVLFCELAGDVLRRTPEAFKRSQTLCGLRSVPLGDELTLTFTRDCELFARQSHLRELVGDRFFESQPIENFDGRSAQAVCAWLWYFGVRFAAVCVCQIAAEAPLPNPFDLAFDGANAAVAFARLEAPSPERALMRTGGRLAPLCCRTLMLGPLRTGIMAAAQALALYRNRTILFWEAAFGWDRERARAFANRAAEYSARDSDPEEVDRAVVSLIQQSLERQNDLFAIPWI
jgi:hypothetical protein